MIEEGTEEEYSQYIEENFVSKERIRKAIEEHKKKYDRYWSWHKYDTIHHDKPHCLFCFVDSLLKEV